MAQHGFVFGVDGLDEYFRDALRSPSLLVVAGHPGSGKTTFSSTVCYANIASNGARCLYVSLQEDKEKFYRFMKSVGLDFEAVEKRGLFKFVKIPITLDAEAAVESISKTVSEFDPKVVVIDSINALMQGIKDEEKRAWIQNYFYELPRAIQGVLVLVAELPFGEERVSLGSIEFVADAIFILKHRIEDGFLSRHIEVRKVRGAPIMLAEIPFTISSCGFRVWVPPILSEIGYHGETIPVYCRVLKSVIGDITRGSVTYVEYPPDFRTAEVALIPIAVICTNNLKAIVMSYRYPPKILEHIIASAMARAGIDEDSAVDIIRRHLELKGLNPFSKSLTQLYAEELEYVMKAKPDVVVFHGIELLASVVERSRYVSKVYNQLNAIKSMGCTVFRFSSRVDDWTSGINSTMADVVIRILPIDTGSGSQRYRLYVWKKGGSAYVMAYEEVLECLRELGNLIKLRCSCTRAAEA